MLETTVEDYSIVKKARVEWYVSIKNNIYFLEIIGSENMINIYKIKEVFTASSLRGVLAIIQKYLKLCIEVKTNFQSQVDQQ